MVPYTTFGTRELADGLRAALTDRHVALLQNHGAVAVGRDIEQAYDRARLLEWLAELYYRSRCLGTPRVLSPAELDAFDAQVAALSYGADSYGAEDRPPGTAGDSSGAADASGTADTSGTADASGTPDMSGTADAPGTGESAGVNTPRG